MHKKYMHSTQYMQRHLFLHNLLDTISISVWRMLDINMQISINKRMRINKYYDIDERW